MLLQAQEEAGKVRCRPRTDQPFGVRLPPASVQALVVISLKPWPLQVFWPLHSF
jgi:hypothetical protein